MRKSFSNFLTGTVFILLSGFLLFQANATSGQTLVSLQSTYSQVLNAGPSNAHFSPVSSGFDTHFGQILIEEAESENLDPVLDNEDFNPDFFQHGIAALFQLMGWEHASANRENHLAYHTPSLKECKRYIRFEDFRI